MPLSKHHENEEQKKNNRHSFDPDANVNVAFAAADVFKYILHLRNPAICMEKVQNWNRQKRIK